MRSMGRTESAQAGGPSPQFVSPNSGSRIAVRSSAGWTGFCRSGKSSPPSLRRSPAVARPENSIARHAGYIVFNRLASSTPLNSGISTSEISRSGAHTPASLSASSGLENASARYPFICRIVASVAAIAGSSSTTKTRYPRLLILIPLACWVDLARESNNRTAQRERSVM